MREKQPNEPVSEVYSSMLRELYVDVQNRDSPITLQVVLAISLVFLAQEVAAVLLGTSVLGVTSYFFLEYPVPAWLLSFFLHRDLTHFFVNVALIVFVGRVVERTFSNRSYVLFVAATAVLSGIGAYLFRAPFTAKPVAAYGASGFGFAIAAYSLYVPYRGRSGLLDLLKPENVHADTTPSERIAFLLGVAAVLTVILDLFSGPFLTVEWVNGAHLTGVVVGLFVGKRCSPTGNNE